MPTHRWVAVLAYKAKHAYQWLEWRIIELTGYDLGRVERRRFQSLCWDIQQRYDPKGLGGEGQ